MTDHSSDVQSKPFGLLEEGNGGLQNLGSVLREILSKLKELEHVGVESSQIPLPKIALLGDQSSGKSSLVEAITEIQVPRAAGTCTRCPLLINTTNQSGDWSCVIKIHQKYDYFGQLRINGAGTMRDPWRLKDVPEDIYTGRLDSRAELKKAIQLAQCAILNPNVSPDAIMTEKFVPEEDRVSFSPNVIRLEIKGPTLPTLQLYDLPGVITQYESTDDAHLPELVCSLAKRYIGDKNTIIVLACSMESDPHTSNAAALVREMNAQYRCLGMPLVLSTR